MTVYVQFEDDTQRKIISVFGSPQSPENYANYAELDESDERYIEFISNNKSPFDSIPT